MKKFVAMAIGAAILLASAGTAFADSASINVVVPKFGGAVTTGKTTRVSYTNNWNWSLAVGGGYTIGIEPRNVSGSIIYKTRQWANSGSTTYDALPPIGAEVWASIANSWSTPVNVQVSGSWNTN